MLPYNSKISVTYNKHLIHTYRPSGKLWSRRNSLNFSEPGWMPNFGSDTGLFHKFFCQDTGGRSKGHLRQDIFMVEIRVPEVHFSSEVYCNAQITLLDTTVAFWIKKRIVYCCSYPWQVTVQWRKENSFFGVSGCCFIRMIGHWDTQKSSRSNQQLVGVQWIFYRMDGWIAG